MKLKHLLIHQCFCSAICDSQQQISPCQEKKYWVVLSTMVMRPQILHRQLWNQNYDLPALFACSFPRFETKTVTCLVFLKLSKCTYSHFSLAWKSKYWYLCHFFMVFRVLWSNTTLFSSCCWHRYAVFSCVFHVFGFQFTDHPFGQLENVFRVWSLVAKNEENIINHTCMELSGTTKCDIHVRSEFSILRHKKAQLATLQRCAQGLTTPNAYIHK